MADNELRWELEKVFDASVGTVRNTRWEDCGVPVDVCIRQDQWEREVRIALAYVSGATQIEIAKSLGLSQGRVHQILQSHAREYRLHKGASPIARYLSEKENPITRRPPKKFSTMVAVMATFNDGRDWLRI